MPVLARNGSDLPVLHSARNRFSVTVYPTDYRVTDLTSFVVESWWVEGERGLSTRAGTPYSIIRLAHTRVAMARAAARPPPSPVRGLPFSKRCGLLQPTPSLPPTEFFALENVCTHAAARLIIDYAFTCTIRCGCRCIQEGVARDAEGFS